MPPKQITRSSRIQYWEHTLPLASCIFVPAPLDDSCPLPASQSTCCFALWLKDQTYFDSHFRRTLLGNWCQRGEREHIKAYHMGEKAHLSFSRCLLTIEERSHVSLRGEIHVSVCFTCFVLIFFYPIFSHYPISDSGEKELIPKGRKSLEFTAYLYSLGTCLYPNKVLSTHSLHVIPNLVLLWFSQFALFSRCSCVI